MELGMSYHTLLGGAATCPEGFVNCFLRVPRLLGYTAAAMLPKQARGTYYRTFGTSGTDMMQNFLAFKDGKNIPLRR